MATASRTLWKGAITFGLVHIPVGLHTASIEQGVDFDWLDKRSMDPVGYKRINKRTGKEIDKDDIVKGFEYEDGKYVVISPEEIEAIYPRTTQTIEIQRFIDANEIPFVYLERPYYVAPINKGQKVYALLREVLVKTGKVGLAKVVIATKQHLAALVPAGEVLVLNLLRWGDEVKSLAGLDLPAAGVKGAKVNASEMKMAEQLVKDMSGKWNPDEFKDEFKHAVMKVVEKKVKAGDTETVIEPEEEAPAEGAEIIDLTELLTRSLKGGKAAKSGGTSAKKSAGSKTGASAKKTGAAAKKAPRKKASGTRRKAA
ncbi:DNA end-binding protein Ku [Variovorax paradoxus]|uniref:non-homologous end joining protein Ku n=1 Tax=Variovorax paradoxus TaxID=34073 RepID=UPI002788D762|nr:Ku protein [Variovorax paradoxus]MDQ0025025.1 DNA end-binding protein Ku [Variovorax paradoxus]